MKARFWYWVVGGITLLGLFASGGVSRAEYYSVFQESAAGAGDFTSNFLGNIQGYTTTKTGVDFYQYGTPNGSSYNGEMNGGPEGVNRLSQLFLVEASDGLWLMLIHDKARDGSGGTCGIRCNLINDTIDTSFFVSDDPNEVNTLSAGNTQLNTSRNWAACCTDGVAVGDLDNNWEALVQFTARPSGITSWQATSSDGNDLGLVLATGRRVKLLAVPEPTNLMLAGFAVAGLAGGAWRRRRSK